MDLWTSLLDILILLSAALLLGCLFERLKQNAILGYLLAGTLLGPNALDWMPNHEAIGKIAELGVALLLFTIGLEFSWRKLRSIGRIALGGGTAQVVITGAIAGGLCLVLGTGGRTAIAIGAMIALSSTAFVLRLLVSRAEIDGVHGRSALGILLLQDIAVVPLVLIVSALGDEGGASAGAVMLSLGRSLLIALALVMGLYLVLNYVLPRLLRADQISRNRDVPVLLAMITAIGSAWVSHKLGLSPVLGAFIAGMMLADSPFATQIHSDVASLRSLFVVLFFSAIGMLGDPSFVWEHWHVVVAVVAAIVFGKAIVTSGVARLLGSSWGHAVATGVCLAQVGEFSFVLAEVARGGALLDEYLFNLLIAATIGTLFLTPFLVGLAPRMARFVGRWSASAPLSMEGAGSDDAPESARELRDHIVIIGFGPAGQCIAETLMSQHKSSLLVLDLNPKAADLARASGLRSGIGDATHRDVLEHARIAQAAAVVVALPDPDTVRRVVSHIRSMSDQVPVVARSRYHVYSPELAMAGAEVVIDEEREVGRRMAAAVRRMIRARESKE